MGESLGISEARTLADDLRRVTEEFNRLAEDAARKGMYIDAKLLPVHIAQAPFPAPLLIINVAVSI
jgi:hypothetical protein